MSSGYDGRSGANRGDANGEKSRPIWAWESGRLWAIDLAQSEPVVISSHLKIGATFAEIQSEQLQALADVMGGHDPRSIQHRLDAGKRCFAGQVDGRLAAYCWVSQSAECIGEIEHEIHFQPDEVYIWDCATLPEYRRKGLYSFLLAFMTGQLRSDGIRRVWIGSSLDNQASMGGFVRAGFKPVADMVFVRILTLSAMWVNGVPSAPVALVESARRILTATWPHAVGRLVYDINGHGQARYASKAQPACKDQAA